MKGLLACTGSVPQPRMPREARPQHHRVQGQARDIARTRQVHRSRPCPFPGALSMFSPTQPSGQREFRGHPRLPAQPVSWLASRIRAGGPVSSRRPARATTPIGASDQTCEVPGLRPVRAVVAAPGMSAPVRRSGAPALSARPVSYGAAAMVGSTRRLTCGIQPAHGASCRFLCGRQSDLSVPVRGRSPVSVRAARRPGISVRATRARRGRLSVQSVPAGLNCSRLSRSCPWIPAPALSAICP
jgi:hypothetical protein